MRVISFTTSKHIAVLACKSNEKTMNLRIICSYIFFKYLKLNFTTDKKLSNFHNGKIFNRLWVRYMSFSLNIA